MHQSKERYASQVTGPIGFTCFWLIYERRLKHFHIGFHICTEINPCGGAGGIFPIPRVMCNRGESRTIIQLALTGFHFLHLATLPQTKHDMGGICGRRMVLCEHATGGCQHTPNEEPMIIISLRVCIPNQNNQ